MRRGTLSSIRTGRGRAGSDYLSLDIEGGGGAVLESFPSSGTASPGMAIEKTIFTANRRIPGFMRRRWLRAWSILRSGRHLSKIRRIISPLARIVAFPPEVRPPRAAFRAGVSRRTARGRAVCAAKRTDHCIKRKKVRRSGGHHGGAWNPYCRFRHRHDGRSFMRMCCSTPPRAAEKWHRDYFSHDPDKQDLGRW